MATLLSPPMQLSSITAAVPELRLVRDAAPGSPELVAVTDDSRRAGPGMVFVARAGTKTDGAEYLAEAMDREVTAVIVRPGTPVASSSADPAVLLADDPATAGAAVAEVLAGSPSRSLSICAVTGTNGKTTVAFLVRQLCAAAGVGCGLVGTILTDDGATAEPARLTTPTAWELSPLLARMVGNGCRAAAIEASSHALHQRRLAGIRISVGVYTNLSGDHLDYHGSMDAYADAKAILFEGLDADATAVVNVDDPHAERMLRQCRARVVRCSLDGARHVGDGTALDAVGEVIESGAWGSRVAIRLGGSLGALSATVTIPLVGLHNAMNALQATAAAIALGVPAPAVVAALGSVTAPPGRLERVRPSFRGGGGAEGDCPLSVLVDYAHTDDALESVLKALRPVVPLRENGGSARLIVVFGCGGDRDRTKRPRMAAAACRHADLVVVTSDNPRTEPPESIIDEIVGGVPAVTAARVLREADRAKAIAIAVDEADPGDVVLIAGKGHETEQIVGSERRAFDDRVVATEALTRRLASLATDRHPSR